MLEACLGEPWLTWSVHSLSELVLSGNHLSLLVLSDPSCTTSASPPPTPTSGRLARLERLSLVGNRLAAWSTTVDALAACASTSFPALRSLRLAGNPLVSPHSAEAVVEGPPATAQHEKGHDLLALPSSTRDREALHARLLVIARLPSINELEGTPVSPAERDDAERFWLEQLAKGVEDESQLGEWAKERVRQLRESESRVLSRQNDVRS